jgi:hypothetical protein
VGDIATLQFYNHYIDDKTMRSIMDPWCEKLQLRPKKQPPDARKLALASLAQVLVSSNEFLYID